MSYINPLQEKIGEKLYPFVMPIVTWSDPITVTITLILFLAPIGLIWTTICRIIFVQLAQSNFRGRRVLFVIAKPEHLAK